MKSVLLLISAMASIPLNAANYNSGQIHPLELIGGVTEEMHLLDLAAQKALIAEERANTHIPAQIFDDNSAHAQEIEKKAREHIEKSAKDN